jgi:1,2-diacylglycerol 3-alpha-glucosyltransferase
VTETQGLVTLEAMAAGLPVAAVDATGTGDAVEQDRQGFLTENNSTALTAAIEHLLQDQDLRQRFGQAARQRAQTFGIRNLSKKLLDVYALAGEEAKHGRFVRCEISV